MGNNNNKKKKKKRKASRVPEVLWRVFNKRVHTLGETIISLIPFCPSPIGKCRCKGRRCLGCIPRDKSISFLLRPKDSSDYRNLLTICCFVVVKQNAPPISNYDHRSHWTQLQIVRRTIERIMEQCPANLICTGFDKVTNIIYSQYPHVSVRNILAQRHLIPKHASFEVIHSERTGNSAIVELLSSSAWEILLKRVGDSLMVYLLENTLIFLPLAQKQHIQVSGLSIKQMCFAALNRVSKSDLGFERKRKITNEVDSKSTEQQASSPLESSLLLHSSTCIGCSRKQYIAQFDGHRSKGFLQSAPENNVATSAAENACIEKHIPCMDQYNSTVALPKKCSRQWRWQRQRSLNSRRFSLGPCREGVLERFKALQACSCCSAFQSLPNVNEEAHLNRRIMLYKMEDCSSVFPRNHILNSLKPNFTGANSLLNEILGNCLPSTASGAMPCFHSCNICQIGSKCLYHSLTKLLKVLIHNAQRCHLSRLLEKHCSVPPSFEKDLNGSAYISEGSYSEGTHACKKRKIIVKDNVRLENKFEGDCGSDLLCDRQPKQQMQGSYSKGNHACKKRKILLKETVIFENKFVGDCGSDVHCSSRPTQYDSQYGPSNLYCSHKQVTSFTWAVCRSIIPPDLLGNPSTWRKLRMNISRFIRLRRFENFSLKQCMHELKISKFPLLSDKHSSCNLSTNIVMHSGGCETNGGSSGRSAGCDKVDQTDFVKHKILKCWIYWLFSCLVVPLLQANFYVTESEDGKQELFYYQKAVWEKVISETVTRLETRNFHHLNDASLRKIVRYRSFGFSRARLCPKGSGVRVLANLKAPSKIPLRLSPLTGQNIRRGTSTSRLKTTEYKMFKSVNSVLRSIHVILKGIQMEQPDKLGSSAFDYNDVYKRFVPFVSLLRNGCTIIPKVYIVVADVSRAFDSVNQNKLLEVVKTVLVDDEYRLSKSDKVICTKKSFRVQQLLSTHHYNSQPGILVNQGLSIIIKKENIVSDLVEHIQHNILQLGDKFYLQSVGIPQGSIVSSLLCSFYYGHMEKNVINPYLDKLSDSRALENLRELHSDNTLTSGGNSTDNVNICNLEYLLLRFIDDYLFISTSEQQASQFFSRLQRGFCDYNAFMNERKFGSNFHVNHKSEHEANRVFVGEDGIPFLKWSGLLINSCTLEIQADYSRYLDCHLSSTITVSWRGKTYRNLRAKLCDYLRPKCHPIFYDANINSPPVVRLNIYQIFLLCAMKFHSYVSVLFNLRGLNIKSIIGSLDFSLRYMHKLIRKRNHSLFCISSVHPSFEVEKREIEWLGLFAYIRVFKRKQSRYVSMLSLLESKLKSLPINENISPELKYATDDSHSSLFWKIKY